MSNSKKAETKTRPKPMVAVTIDKETKSAELHILMQAVRRYFEKTGAKKFSAYAE